MKSHTPGPWETDMPGADSNGTISAFEEFGSITSLFVLMDPDEDGATDTKRIDCDQRMFIHMWEGENGDIIGRRVILEEGGDSIVFV